MWLILICLLMEDRYKQEEPTGQIEFVLNSTYTDTIEILAKPDSREKLSRFVKFETIEWELDSISVKKDESGIPVGAKIFAKSKRKIPHCEEPIHCEESIDVGQKELNWMTHCVNGGGKINYFAMIFQMSSDGNKTKVNIRMWVDHVEIRPTLVRAGVGRTLFQMKRVLTALTN